MGVAMELEVYKKDGTKSGEKVKLSEEIFGVEPNLHLIYRAVRTYLDNQRQGTAKVKTRAEVRGGGRKPFRQKHTGMARQGTSRSPVMVGGGAIFGPKPHDFTSTLPATMRRAARKSALSIKARDGQIKVVEDFTFGGPKTKEMAVVLKALDLGGTKIEGVVLPSADSTAPACRLEGAVEAGASTRTSVMSLQPVMQRPSMYILPPSSKVYSTE